MVGAGQHLRILRITSDRGPFRKTLCTRGGLCFFKQGLLVENLKLMTGRGATYGRCWAASPYIKNNCRSRTMTYGRVQEMGTRIFQAL